MEHPPWASSIDQQGRVIRLIEPTGEPKQTEADKTPR
jgi:hypothetical protein